MTYKINPEKGCMVEKETYWKENKEFHVGIVWKWGCVYTNSKPSFLKNYDPNIGIKIYDISEFEGYETQDGDVEVFFSETISDSEKEMLEDVLSDYSYKELLEDMGWDTDESEIVIWGELTISKVDE